MFVILKQRRPSKTCKLLFTIHPLDAQAVLFPLLLQSLSKLNVDVPYNYSPSLHLVYGYEISKILFHHLAKVFTLSILKVLKAHTNQGLRAKPITR